LNFKRMIGEVVSRTFDQNWHNAKLILDLGEK
jgi:hypothetical protein